MMRLDKRTRQMLNRTGSREDAKSSLGSLIIKHRKAGKDNEDSVLTYSCSGVGRRSPQAVHWQTSESPPTLLFALFSGCTVAFDCEGDACGAAAAAAAAAPAAAAVVSAEDMADT
jgi:hypothetical protein